jgi:endonuclease/exonuclease/phosphatase family metal-dependent hydrolase
MISAEIEKIEVATLNFELSKALSLDGLKQVMNADILLCQEITRFPAEPLWEAGFDLVDFMPEAGLAVAKRKDSKLERVPGPRDSHTLQKMGKRETALVSSRTGFGNPFRERGIQIVSFMTNGGQRLTVANTHPSPPILEADRKRQVRQIPKLLEKVVGPLVLGGDFNHYGKAMAVDEQIQRHAGVSKVDIGSTYTWMPSRDSAEGKILGLIARLQGVPVQEYGGQLDAMYYRGEGLTLIESSVVQVKQTDHDAIVAAFTLTS